MAKDWLQARLRRIFCYCFEVLARSQVLLSHEGEKHAAQSTVALQPVFISTPAIPSTKSGLDISSTRLFRQLPNLSLAFAGRKPSLGAGRLGLLRAHPPCLQAGSHSCGTTSARWPKSVYSSCLRRLRIITLPLDELVVLPEANLPLFCKREL